jgi:hypothetical protein
VRRKATPYKGRKCKKRVTDEELQGMAAAYREGKSMAEIGRLFVHRRGPVMKGRPRNQKDVRAYLVEMGVAIRHSKTSDRPRGPHGEMIAAPRLTDAQVRKVIAAMPAAARREHPFKIPAVMRNEWRGYPLERRRWVLGLLRERFPSTMPRDPFSANVTPFDYASEAAWEILRTVNAGLPSRQWKMRLFPTSEGVIFEGQLWFWIPNSGYLRGIYNAAEKRPSLNQHIWRLTHGCEVPAGHVVRHVDANPNNFEPVNLVLASRNDVARENQAAFYTRHSRETTALLLKRSQTHDQDEDLLEKIHRTKKMASSHHAAAE